MDHVERQAAPRWVPIVRILVMLFFLYLFLVSIKLLGGGFKHLGKDFAEQLVQTTRNPFVGLVIGILATSLVQSSSMTTSMVVGLVAGGALPLKAAVPMVMGANIGTTVTNLIVSLGHVGRRQEFERALAAASVHDFFNLIAVVVLLPLELMTGYLRTTATWLAEHLSSAGPGGVKFTSPLKTALKPVVTLVEKGVSGLPEKTGAAVMIVLALFFLFVSLYMMVKVMRSATLARMEVVFDRYMDRHGLTAMLLGVVVTALVQSSSITTSLLVPMAAAGIVRVEQIFPITLGANVGTTVTALLASLAGDVSGLAIALVHVLFNLTGILLVYPVPAIRRVPIRMSRWFARVASRRRVLAFMYVLGTFYVLPLLLVFIYRWAK
jgi:sodium-dependent phosphate cotransporter